MTPSSTPADPEDRRRGGVLAAAEEIVTQAAAASVTTPGAGSRQAAAPPAAGTARRATASRGGRRRRGLRPPGPVPIIVALMVVIITGLGFERLTGIAVLPSGLTASLQPPPRRFPVLESSPPVGLAIRSIQLAAPVHNVGIAADGTIAVPGPDRAQEAGWYDQSPTPGQYGPAVIVGHVDTRTGPAVFHQLGRLRPGDKVDVDRQDGSIAVFEVNSIRRFDKEALPAEQVFGDFSRPGLRLITCGGRWVGGTTGYADNLVVFASLVDAR